MEVPIDLVKMNITKMLYVTDRGRWRRWLEKNHDAKKEIWLVYYRKGSGKKRIAYNDAVEEALCFGWIDSTVKKVDSEGFAQRFTPRRPGSILSQMNKERIRILIAEKRMTPAGLKAVSHAFNPKHDRADDFKIPARILGAIKRDKEAWANFSKLPAHYIRIRIAYIIDRKRHGDKEFRSSLEHFIKMTAKGKRFGFVR